MVIKRLEKSQNGADLNTGQSWKHLCWPVLSHAPSPFVHSSWCLVLHIPPPLLTAIIKSKHEALDDRRWWWNHCNSPDFQSKKERETHQMATWTLRLAILRASASAFTFIRQQTPHARRRFLSASWCNQTFYHCRCKEKHGRKQRKRSDLSGNDLFDRGPMARWGNGALIRRLLWSFTSIRLPCNRSLSCSCDCLWWSYKKLRLYTSEKQKLKKEAIARHIKQKFNRCKDYFVDNIKKAVLEENGKLVFRD